MITNLSLCCLNYRLHCIPQVSLTFSATLATAFIFLLFRTFYQVYHVRYLRLLEPSHSKDQEGDLGPVDQGVAEVGVSWLRLCRCGHWWIQWQCKYWGRLREKVWVWKIEFVIYCSLSSQRGKCSFCRTKSWLAQTNSISMESKLNM